MPVIPEHIFACMAGKSLPQQQCHNIPHKMQQFAAIKCEFSMVLMCNLSMFPDVTCHAMPCGLVQIMINYVWIGVEPYSAIAFILNKIKISMYVLLNIWISQNSDVFTREARVA